MATACSRTSATYHMSAAQEEETMGLWDKLTGGDPGKAAKATTPPLKKQTPKYTPKKQIKAKNPKKQGK